MGVENLKYEISQLKLKLSELQQTVEYSNDYERGLDVYTETKKTTRGSSAEIARIKAQIAEKEEQLRKAEQWAKGASKRDAEMERIRKETEAREKQEKKEASEMEKRSKQSAMNLVQKAYKRGTTWQRFKAFARGKNPSKRKLSKLSAEELKFLVDLSNGNTVEQQEYVDRLDDKKLYGNLTQTEKRARSKKKNWSDFMSAMNSKTVLERKKKSQELKEENEYSYR